jgi:NAD-dependent deacetylase
MWTNEEWVHLASTDALYNETQKCLDFYNWRRKKLAEVEPNDAHRMIAELEKEHEVTVITQNVDNLHEMAGSTHVIHLHGELMKVCSSRDVDNPRYQKTLGGDNLEVKPGEKAGDGSLLRPFIVFFGEGVPNISIAAEEASKADIFIIIGTSLVVYPAAGLVQYVSPDVPVYLIDPNPVMKTGYRDIKHIQKGASEGMKDLVELLLDKK